MLKGEDESTADTDIDSIMRAIHNELIGADTHAHPLDPDELDDTRD
jgi:hypothetical protein